MRQKREEIAWIQGFVAYTQHLIYGPVRQRILDLLEAQLAELESSLTDWAKAHVEELLKEH